MRINPYLWKLRSKIDRILPFKLPFFLYPIFLAETQPFISSHIQTVDFFRSRQTPSLSLLSQFDVIIVGSDQVWRAKYLKPSIYFLDFAVESTIIRIAYAASFGCEHIDEYTSEEIDRCRQLAQKFDAISVREDSGLAICQEQFNYKAEHTLDPTLLLEKEDYTQLIKHLPTRQPSLLTYTLDHDSSKKTISEAISAQLKLPIRMTGLGATPEGEDSRSMPSVESWLNEFRNAAFVVTDSFHGMVFSIIFNKPFIVIKNKSRGAARFESLLRIVGLENRLIDNIKDLDSIDLMDINFEKVNARKKEWKDKSIQFLVSALN